MITTCPILPESETLADLRSPPAPQSACGVSLFPQLSYHNIILITSFPVISGGLRLSAGSLLPCRLPRHRLCLTASVWGADFHADLLQIGWPDAFCGSRTSLR